MTLKKPIKYLFTAFIVSGFLVTGPSMAYTDAGIGSFSANVGYFSEYRFRGLDQNGEATAIQGGFDWAHNSGFYLGSWASNIEFNEATSASEFDLYAGYSKELKNGLGIDLSLIEYIYPGATKSLNYDYWELAFGLGKTIGHATVTSAINWSDDFFGGSDNATYFQGGIDYELTLGLILSGHIGKQWIEDNTTYGSPDYLDYSIGASYPWQGFDISVVYIATDIDDTWNNTNQVGKDGTTVLGLSRSF
jgi:uncharacterized protein (TIGR02001 family)